MKLYRIYTEDKKNDVMITNLVARAGFDGATLLHGIGVYKGVSEYSLVIEVGSGALGRVQCLAEAIKAWNVQESVMIVTPENDMIFV